MANEVKSLSFVVPQHRRLLYELFTKHYRLRRAVVQARLSQEFGEVSKAEVDRLLHVRTVFNTCAAVSVGL